MNNKKNYLVIEGKIFSSLGKIGYVIIFTIIFSIFMSVVDFILHCFVDNFYTSKFLFSKEMSFSNWIDLMWSNYSYPYFKIIFFAIIFIAIGIYRCKTLSSEFSK